MNKSRETLGSPTNPITLNGPGANIQKITGQSGHRLVLTGTETLGEEITRGIRVYDKEDQDEFWWKLKHIFITTISVKIAGNIYLVNKNSFNKFAKTSDNISNREKLADIDRNTSKLTPKQQLQSQINRINNLLDSLINEDKVVVIPNPDNPPKSNGVLTLDYRRKQLTALPDEIGSFTSLQSLDLGRNELTALPAEIGKLTSLQRLELGFNQLTALPAEIGKLTSLQSLNLSANQLTALPASIENLTNLQALYLGSNQLRALPAEIGSLTSLQSLDLYRNQLRALPAEIGSLTSLRILNLSYNPNLTSLPNEIFNLPSTCDIYLENTGLSVAVLNRLDQEARRRVAAGETCPRFHFSIRDRSGLNDQQSIEDLTKNLNRLAGKEYSISSLLEMLDQDQKDQLKQWIDRLSDTADFKNTQQDSKKQFANKILDILGKVETDEDFRNIFLLLIEDAASTCGDRVALSILKLDIKYKIATFDIANHTAKELADLIINGEMSMGLLEQVAREKVKTLRFVDEIEVFLGYPIKLKEALELPFDGKEMLYYACSGITENDLNTAKEYVMNARNNKEECYRFLASNDTWRKALETYPLTKERYSEEFGESENLEKTVIKFTREVLGNDSDK